MDDKYKVIDGTTPAIERQLNELEGKWKIVHMTTTGMVASNFYGAEKVHLHSVVILEREKEE